MRIFLYKVLYFLFYTTSLLPWWLFYKISDFCFLVVYYVLGYRKEVVTDNLRQAFPEKSWKEIKVIRRKFYRFMCDMFLENIKQLTISKKEMQKRFVVTNPEVLDKMHMSPKSGIILAGHYGSFEWSNSMEIDKPYQFVAAYKPVRNAYFNDLVIKNRAKYGAEVVPSKEVLRYVIGKERKEKGQRFYGLVADQSPSDVKKDTLFLSFMGRKVPVFTGGEFLARKFDMHICYMKVGRKKRGFYEAEIVMIEEEVTEGEKFSATKKYFEILESQIKEKPELYLWSHKRWKNAI